MEKKFKRALLYLTLIGISGLFLFPFYWVLISSVKSVEGISMRPPSYYPSEYHKTTVTLNATSRIVREVAGPDSVWWFRLRKSRDLLTQDPTPGAYYVRLDSLKPGQYLSWFPESVVQPVAGPPNITFDNLTLHRIEGEPEAVPLLAKMVRAKGASYDELLFFTENKKPSEVYIAKNRAHQEERKFHARWENYPETLKGPEATIGQEQSTGFLLFMRNSFIISILSMIGQVLSSSLVAYGFARLNFRGREGWFVVLLATMMIPAQVTMIPMFAIFKTIGWVNSFLPLVVPQFTAGAFNVFLLRQYMLTLPKELDDSAAIDGCGPFRTFFYVILPNSIPVLIVVGLFTFVGAWQDVMGPLIYLDDPDYRTVTLGLEYFRSPYVDTRHLIMTGAVLAMFPVAILFLIFQRYIVAGIATTGMKT
ncbi:MAG: carbohydrate ABC transporter permease [Bacteroidetes Order II. Incertae sedis bacterium]|nr:carbohydrate ABC transporter permease [Bacteroidetes Order II. bacterium]